MNLVRAARKLLQEYNHSPSQRLGQHFMVNEHFLSLIKRYADLQPTDIVLEVGPGLGFLTRYLAQTAGQVIAVETDTSLIKILENELAAFDNVTLISGDILKIPLPHFDKIVSNPPFSISSTLLLRTLNTPFHTAVFTFQKEFVQRLTATKGEETYGALAVIASCLADVELLDEVPKEGFFPAPEVDSNIVRMRLKYSLRLEVSTTTFCNVVRTLFMKRNRKVRNAIKPLIETSCSEPRPLIEGSRVSKYLDRRVRDLLPRDFEVIADAFSG
ncbi:MAG: ribosomal RNA small subunit methyltransferase A [Candidatus Bathyarchaeota archaeon]|nr:MAG: ribosomal RNA small subunit methyltransferase A [Candidatus Bathyarchaeota archaeon]